MSDQDWFASREAEATRMLFKAEANNSTSRDIEAAKAGALSVIGQVLARLAQGIEWCGHDNIRVTCPYFHNDSRDGSGM